MSYVATWGKPGVGVLALRHDGFLNDSPPWSLDMRAMMIAVRIQGREEGDQSDGYGAWKFDHTRHVGDINGAQFWDKASRTINMMRFATPVVIGTGAAASGRRGHGGSFEPVGFPQFIDPATGLPFGGPGSSGFPTFTDQETGGQFGQQNGGFPSFIDPATGQPFTGPQGGFPGFTPAPDPPSFPPGYQPPPGGGGPAAQPGAPPPAGGQPPQGDPGNLPDQGPVPGFPQGWTPPGGSPSGSPPGGNGGGGGNGLTQNIFLDDPGTDTQPGGT